MTKRLKLRLVVDVTYDLNGESANDIHSLLQEALNRSVGNGMLTNGSPLEVVSWKAKIVEVPRMLSEGVIADFMQKRIDNDDLEGDDIPVRLARYGLMDPVEFVNEMRERIAQSKKDW